MRTTALVSFSTIYGRNELNEGMDCLAPALLHGIIIFAVATSSVAVSPGVQ